MLRTKVLLTLLPLLSATPVLAQENSVEWGKYMRSPAAISAISSAVSLATPCLEKLTFEEITQNDEVTIGVHCPGVSGYEFSVFINFMIIDGNILPRGFDLAG